MRKKFRVRKQRNETREKRAECGELLSGVIRAAVFVLCITAAAVIGFLIPVLLLQKR